MLMFLKHSSPIYVVLLFKYSIVPTKRPMKHKDFIVFYQKTFIEIWRLSYLYKVVMCNLMSQGLNNGLPQELRGF